MAVTYGVNVTQGETRGQPPLQVSSEIPAIFGAFPCDLQTSPTMGYPGEWKEVTSWADFKEKYGFEEQWGADQCDRADGWNAAKSVYRIMSGFGVFSTKVKKARMARNPRTGAKVPVPSRVVPSFRYLGSLKQLVKANTEK